MEKFEKLSKRFFDGLGKSFSVLMPIFVFIFAIQIGVGIFSPAPEWVTKIAPEWIVDTGLMLLAMIVAFFAIILWIKRKKLDWYWVKDFCYKRPRCFCRSFFCYYRMVFFSSVYT